MKYQGDIATQFAANGYGWLNGTQRNLTGEEARGLEVLVPLWEDLVLDPYLKVEGTTRLRRYSRYELSDNHGITRLPHAPFSQDEEHNSLFGGQERTFEPCPPELDENPYFLGLAGLIRHALPNMSGLWQMRTHMVRVEATGSKSAQPVPEGPHRDGYDYIVIHMIGRSGITGGETTIYERGKEVARGTLTNPGDGLLLDDHRFTHDTAPLSVVQDERSGSRDVLLFGLEQINNH